MAEGPRKNVCYFFIVYNEQYRADIRSGGSLVLGCRTISWMASKRESISCLCAINDVLCAINVIIFCDTRNCCILAAVRYFTGHAIWHCFDLISTRKSRVAT